jgi:hypothetical protein
MDLDEDLQRAFVKMVTNIRVSFYFWLSYYQLLKKYSAACCVSTNSTDETGHVHLCPSPGATPFARVHASIHSSVHSFIHSFTLHPLYRRYQSDIFMTGSNADISMNYTGTRNTTLSLRLKHFL